MIRKVSFKFNCVKTGKMFKDRDIMEYLKMYILYETKVHTIQYNTIQYNILTVEETPSLRKLWKGRSCIGCHGQVLRGRERDNGKEKKRMSRLGRKKERRKK